MFENSTLLTYNKTILILKQQVTKSKYIGMSYTIYNIMLYNCMTGDIRNI